MADEKNGEMLRVSIAGGKYTFIVKEDGNACALRYNEPWIDNIACAGDRMFTAMAFELDELRKATLSADIGAVPPGP